MKILFYVLMMSVPVLFVTSCGDDDPAGGGSGTTVNIPSVTFSCTSAGDVNCVTAANGVGVGGVFFAGITCAVLISDDSDSLVADAESGTAATCSSNACTATMTTWVEEENGDPVTKIETGDYVVAAFMDANGNESDGPDNGDVVSCKEVTIGASTTSVDLDDDDLVEFN